MVDRLKREASEETSKGIAISGKRRIEKLVFEGQWHGWLECASLPVMTCFETLADIYGDSAIVDHR